MSGKPISDAVREAAHHYARVRRMTGDGGLARAALGNLIDTVRGEVLNEQARSVDFLASLVVVEHNEVPPDEVWISVAGKRVATIQNVDLVAYRPSVRPA